MIGENCMFNHGSVQVDVDTIWPAICWCSSQLKGLHVDCDGLINSLID